jgi:hypothetical protein
MAFCWRSGIKMWIARRRMYSLWMGVVVGRRILSATARCGSAERTLHVDFPPPARKPPRPRLRLVKSDPTCSSACAVPISSVRKYLERPLRQLSDGCLSVVEFCGNELKICGNPVGGSHPCATANAGVSVLCHGTDPGDAGGST